MLLSASAVGYYGDTGDRTVTEQDPAGHATSSPQLCAPVGGGDRPGRRRRASASSHLRTGLVLDRSRDADAGAGPVFRLGLGGRMGSGRQYWPWISLADEIGAIRHLLTADVSGPVNLTGPEPVTNAEFTARAGPPGAPADGAAGARRSP